MEQKLSFNRLLMGMSLIVLFASLVQAEGIFSITGTVDGVAVSQSYKNIEDLVNSVEEASLQGLAPDYTTVSIVDTVLDFRGINTNVSYLTSSTELSFSIPDLNIYETFQGLTRDESQELLEDYLKENGDDTLVKMLSYLAGNTAIDPVAGNPNSLMSQMGAADFAIGTDLGGGTALKGTASSKATNSLGVGLRFGRYSADGYTQDTYSLPIKYTVRFESNPQKQLIFDLPIVLTDTEGSQGYNTSLGIGFRIPVTKDWSLTPAARFGVVGSIDVGSAAGIYSGSLTSNYNLYWDDFIFTMGNMLSYYVTQSIDVADYSIDYDLQNSMTKNGIGVEGPIDYILLGKPTSWQFNVNHTAFFGDELYVDRYFDCALSFGTRANESSWDTLRVGLTYTYNDKFDGFQINFGYTF